MTRYRGDDEKRVETGIALRKLLDRLIENRILRDSEELNYFTDLFIHEFVDPF